MMPAFVTTTDLSTTTPGTKTHTIVWVLSQTRQQQYKL